MKVKSINGLRVGMEFIPDPKRTISHIYRIISFNRRKKESVLVQSIAIIRDGRRWPIMGKPYYTGRPV